MNEITRRYQWQRTHAQPALDVPLAPQAEKLKAYLAIAARRAEKRGRQRDELKRRDESSDESGSESSSNSSSEPSGSDYSGSSQQSS